MFISISYLRRKVTESEDGKEITCSDKNAWCISQESLIECDKYTIEENVSKEDERIFGLHIDKDGKEIEYLELKRGYVNVYVLNNNGKTINRIAN